MLPTIFVILAASSFVAIGSGYVSRSAHGSFADAVIERRLGTMIGRGTRSFRYGARLAVTGPLAGVFIVVAGEMVVLAVAAGLYWRILFGALATLAGLLAISMVREVVLRLRGKRLIVVSARNVVVPASSRRRREVTIACRDIRALELAGAPGFGRVLRIRHTGGELEISGVMLGSVGELDEIHGLLKAVRKPRT